MHVINNLVKSTKKFFKPRKTTNYNKVTGQQVFTELERLQKLKY